MDTVETKDTTVSLQHTDRVLQALGFPLRSASRHVAIDRIVGFTRRFGQTHLALAYHAALPLVLTPDLLYRIWAGFMPQTPWTAVSDVLLSRLCREVGHELYEMDLTVRNILLESLIADRQFGHSRLNELADFLMEYTVQQLHSDDQEDRRFAQEQRWIVLAYTKPGKAADELHRELVKLSQHKDSEELFRLASIIETCAVPLAHFKPLLLRARDILVPRSEERYTSETTPSISPAIKIVNPIPASPPAGPVSEEQLSELDGLINRLREYYPDFDDRVVRTAFAIASKAHEKQCRKSGEPYITHPIAVAHILIDLKLDPACIAAGLVHDVVEDPNFSLEQISAQCGREVSAIVEGFANLRVIEGRTKTDTSASVYHKMFIAMADDPHVLLIKLAERLDHMRTLEHMSPEKQRRIGHDTLNIYAPLADKLGIWQIKWELEDLAFRYTNPEQYETISRQLSMRRDTREKIIRRVITSLHQELDKAGIKAEITGRPKHIYSIWRKMEREGVPLNQIYDQLGVRVIVGSKVECYHVLGIVHDRWTPIPNEIEDYIATPKESLYQSLHTTILLSGGHPCEIQIRTWEMHEVAEHGIAAHWSYKEGLGRKAEESFDAKLQWLRNLIAWRRELDEDGNFMEMGKTEVLEEQVYVFTPKGKIIDLPQGSTPIDFAYRIHSDIGNQCIGARVNNRQVPLHHQLENGDMVAITTTKQPRGPSRDWLEFVKTTNARNHIVRWFRRQEHNPSIAVGQDMLERELKRLGMTLSFDEIVEANGYKSTEELFLALGVGNDHPRQVVRKVIARQKAAHEDTDPLAKLPETAPRQSEQSNIGIQVRSTNGIHIRLAKCCNPVEGDPIVGFVTRGKGLTIHRADCHNILHERDRARLMDASWGVTQSKLSYPVPIRIEAWDRVGLWRDITSTVADAGINIPSVQQVENRRAGRATLVATLMVDSLAQLTMILDKLNRIPDVIEAHRERSNSS